MAAIEHRGPNAVTNFDVSIYEGLLEKKKKKTALPEDVEQPQQPSPNASSTEEEEEEEEEGEEAEEEPPAGSGELQQQQQHQPDHHQGEEEEEEEEEVEQILVQPLHPLNIELPPSIDSAEMAVVVMDSADEHPWSLCLDTGLFNLLPVPDIPLNRAAGDLLPDLFDDTGFEDNIDFIFDELSNENFDFNPDSLFDTTAAGLVEADILVGNKEETEQQGLTSPPSPPPSSSPSSSTRTTLVSCN